MIEPIPMRRSAQALDRPTCEEVLRRNTSGTLALSDPLRGFPYQVPLSYGYRDGLAVFHGSRSGRKAELALAGGRASLCVIDADDVVPEKHTTDYRSVVAAGRIRVVRDPREARDLLMFMAERFWPGHPDEAAAEIERFSGATAVIALECEVMTGKESRRLAEARRAAAGRP